MEMTTDEAITREEREKHLDWLYRLKSEIFVFMPKDWVIPFADALDTAIKALEQEPRWVPVSERLPELITHKTSWGMVKKSELVYITYQHNGKNQYCPIPCYYHSNGNWYTDRESVKEWANLDEYDDLMDDALCCEVIAWMPLPPSYERGEEE